MPSLRCEGQGETGAAYIQQDLLDALSARRSPSHNLEKEVHQQFDLAHDEFLHEQRRGEVSRDVRD